MGLIRLLIIAALLYGAWRVAKRLLQKPPVQGQPPSDEAQAMLKCAHCGIHVPAPEAFSHQGRHFCSQEHQRLYLEQHDD